MATDYRALWQQLNQRQQAYLLAVYQLDQKAERYYKEQWSVYKRGYPPPASEWRWIRYGLSHPLYSKSELCLTLEGQKLVDQGTGSTFRALENRLYIECKYEEVELAPGAYFAELWVRLTPKGRRLVRTTGNEPPKPKKIKGQLSQWQWWCLEVLYLNRHNQGVPASSLPWSSLLRLRNYKPEALMKETLLGNSFEQDNYHTEITQAGVSYYEANREYYEAAYGDFLSQQRKQAKPGKNKTGFWLDTEAAGLVHVLGDPKLAKDEEFRRAMEELAKAVVKRVDEATQRTE